EERARERARPVRVARGAAAVQPQAREAALALDDAAVAAPVLPRDELVEQPGLAHVLRDVRRARAHGLAVPAELERELRLRDGLRHALRLRHELGLAQPARRPRRGDEPLRVPRAEVGVEAGRHRLRAQLRDRVAGVDALRAPLVAEVAAGALP